MINDDFIERELAHELKMADIKARERQIQRNDMKEQIGWVLMALTTVLVVGILAVLIWWLTLNSSEQNTQRDKDCIEGGGTRVPLNGGSVVCLQLAPVEAQ